MSTGYEFLEGLAWSAEDGALLIIDKIGKLLRLDDDGQITVVADGMTYADIDLDAQGRLVATETDLGRVTVTDAGGDVTVLADGFDGKALVGPNGIAVRSDGNVYFTDFPGPGAQGELDFRGVFRVSPSGTLTAEHRYPAEAGPNGIALSPDEATLYVANTLGAAIDVYDVAADGSISAEPRSSIATKGLPDGVCVDSAGNVFAASIVEGLEAFDADGAPWGTVALPDAVMGPGQPTNCQIGGADGRMLYISTAETLYQVPLTYATTDAAPESLVLEGTWSWQHPEIELPSGAVTASVAFVGDAVGQGAGLTTATPTGQEGYYAFHVSSPDLGEGVVAVQDWVFTNVDGTGSGEVTGVSGAFADMVGTLDVVVTATAPGTLPRGTYVFELRPVAPSPEPAEPTDTVNIEVNSASVAAWTTCDPETLLCTADSAFGGADTMTGDIVGSSGWTGNISSDQVFSINVGTLDGAGEGVFITVSPLNAAETYTVQTEFFGVSGAFAGLAGVGTSTVTTRDATGALAPTSVSTFELSR